MAVQKSPVRLNLAFAQHSNEPERLRQIVFITDGSVGNWRGLWWRLYHESLQDARLFTVGIAVHP